MKGKSISFGYGTIEIGGKISSYMRKPGVPSIILKFGIHL